MMTPKYEPWVDDRNKLPRVEQQIQIQNLGQTTIWIRGFDIFDFDTEELISPDRSREHQSNIPLPKDRHMTYRLPLDMEKRFKIEVRYSKSQNSKRTKLVTLYLDGYMLGLVETDYPPMS
ncbi:hypothetical protein K1728_04265 [Weissella confusa]|uniref:hypothetical protein n=1 Tax=Weissella confusa TaxID=1583 RepID=UPI001C6F697A|nr:hypothetical protein [Weissella confusa]QYU58621.1 hypothetical protein K1728_04265 [Weissella confusa]